MKSKVCAGLLAVGVAWLCAVSVAAQDLAQDLKRFVETPAVTGYEQQLAAEIRKSVEKWKPQSDNMGNVWVTLGSGAPHRLIVAPMDEPGYIVTAITEDGYLRVQRLPQTAPHGLFDQLHSAQPVLIGMRKGKWVSGVVAGLSTHLQGGRRDAPRMNHPDDIYIDVGATSAAEVKAGGIDLLDPIVLERELRPMAGGKLNAMAIGDRFGAAALVELLRRTAVSKLRGTLTVAFVTMQWATSRGLDRLMQQVKPDEMIYVGRMRRAAAGGGGGGGGGGAQRGQQGDQQQDQPRSALPAPGVGVLIGSRDGRTLSALATELGKIAGDGIPNVIATAAALPRVSYTRGPQLPERFAHLSIATVWSSTPAETIDWKDLVSLVDLLQNSIAPSQQGAPPPMPELRTASADVKRPVTAPSMTQILERLIESYGMSGHEGPVTEEIKRLLPSWAKPETDADGNLILQVASRKPGSKAPRIVFVAHSDEIGYEVTSIADDGKLIVRSRGGGTAYFFSGHTMLVHSEKGDRVGVMELPAGWDQPNFEWPRGGGGGGGQGGGGGAQAQAEGGAAAQQQQPRAPIGPRVDVGARNAAEVAGLGIKVGDAITVPKKYRPLLGRRANGRSFDDRGGCASLIAAAWALGPNLVDRDVLFIWATREELGLEGAKGAADRLAEKGEAPDYVFAVDTFVSSDSPIESKRFADAPIGKGFVIRAVDGSNIADRKHVDKLIALARANQIPVQYGATGGGNDGAVFLRHGTVDIPISWPLRYSHSPGEVIDVRDAEALGRIVAAISRSW